MWVLVETASLSVVKWDIIGTEYDDDNDVDDNMNCILNILISYHMPFSEL